MDERWIIPKGFNLDFGIMIPCERKRHDQRTQSHAVHATSFTPEHWLGDSEMQLISEP